VSAKPASVLDVLSLNGAETPCCFATRATGTVRLRNEGTETWHQMRVYTLAFDRAASNYHVTGILLIDEHSYLPLEYTETGQPPKTSGSFVLNYRLAFTIQTPK
jgi:hypothetical protein